MDSRSCSVCGPKRLWSYLVANTGSRHLLPWSIIAVVIIGMLIYGPIAQLDNYHNFADHREWLGIPNAADVLSNVGFAVVGLYGLALVLRTRADGPLGKVRGGYGLFFFALILTAFGSGWYHLVPDNARLIWDRLPISLACAGILAAVWRKTLDDGPWVNAMWCLAGVLSVVWWWYTDTRGSQAGDLRPYLFVQFMPLLLVPILQWRHASPKLERLAFGGAIGLYALAKISELTDHQILDSLGFISGHTLKHLFSVLAGLVLLMYYAKLQKAAQTR